MKFVSNVKNVLAVAGKNVKHTCVTGKILAKKHAPLALAITAGVGFVATAVTAYQSAKKVDKTLAHFEEIQEEGIVVNKREIAVAVAKDVATPVILGVTSTACLVLSYTIQNNRLKAVTAALALVTEEHERYRLRAKEILDEATFKKIDTPIETKTIETEEGEKEVSIIKEGDFYGKWFCYSHEYVADSPAYNEQLIREVEIKAIETIMKKGVLMFNELQEMLGFDNISNSLPFGWTDNDGFFLEFDEHVVWNEKLQMDEPQLYVRWTTPRNIYSTTRFKDLLKGS